MTGLLAAAWLALAAPAPASSPPPEPDSGPIVDGVILKLPPGEDAWTLEGLVAARAGQPLSPRALRRTVTLLYQLGRFSDVTIRTVSAGQGHVVLLVECLPKRVVKAVAISGPSRQVLGDEQIRAALGLGPGDEYWQARLEQGVEKLRALYLRRGYRQARVGAATSGDNAVEVELHVEEGPPTRVATVDLGPSLAHGAAARWARLSLQPGAVLDLDALERAVQELRTSLRRHRWLRSRVPEPVVEVQGTSARVRVAVEPGPRILLRFAGNRLFTDRELQAVAAIGADQGLDEAVLDAAVGRIRAFYQERGWAGVQLGVRELPAGDRAVLRFEIAEGRRYLVDSIEFTGSPDHDAGWLRRHLRDAFDALPPRPEVEPLAAEEEELAPGAEGGSPTWRRSLSMAPEGERLEQGLGTGRPRRGWPQAEPGEVWYEPAFQAALAAVVDQMRGEGYLEAAPEGMRATLDDRRGAVAVELRLRAGPRTRVESVAFEGNAAVGLPALLAAARIAPGDPLSFAAVEQTRAALLGLFAGKGHLYARVQDQEDFSPDRTRAAVRFRIEEGPQVHLASIELVGNVRTFGEVIRGTLGFKAGDVYDPAAVARAQTALLRLGVFRSVALRLNDPEVPETQKDLTVEMLERPRVTVTGGPGISYANGPRALLEYSQPNLFGQALELAGRAKVNLPLVEWRPDLRGKTTEQRLEGYANVGLRYPRIRALPFQVAVHLDAIGEAAHRKAYDLYRGSAVLGFDALPVSHLSFPLAAEFEVDNIKKKGVAVTVQDSQRLRFPDGTTTLISLRPGVALDLRDQPLHPRSGVFAAVTLDYARSLAFRDRTQGHSWLLGGLIPGSETFTDMLKVDATLSGYLPLWRSAVLAASARGGRVLPLSSDSATIGPKRFFLGGAATMRGAAEDEMIPEDRRAAARQEVAACSNSLTGLGCTQAGRDVIAGRPPTSEGGEAYLLGKLELRQGIGRWGGLPAELGFFLDAGNLWLDPLDVSLRKFRYHVGVGLRLVTPIGPAAIDVGFNTAPDRKLAEDWWAFHFSIGLF